MGALAGDNAMTSKVGETVPLVHSQANRDTRPAAQGGLPATGTGRAQACSGRQR